MAESPPNIGRLVSGPQSGGRGYRVLERSAGTDLSPDAEGRLNALPQALAHWADTADGPAVALIPLSDRHAPALLMRMAYFGAGTRGSVAYANGLLIDEAALRWTDGHPERLLTFLPMPESGTDFATAPLRLSRIDDQPPPRRDWSGFALEWLDRLLLVTGEAEVEPTLRSILAEFPLTPASRVRGWATTGLLAPAGGFSPARDLQLLVVERSRPRADGLHYLSAPGTPEGPKGYAGEALALTPAALAWEKFKTICARDSELAPALSEMRWNQQDWNAKPVDVLSRAAATVARRLDGAAQMRLIVAMATPRGEADDGDFAAAARALLAAILAAPGLSAQHAAFYVKALAEAPAAATSALPNLEPLLVQEGTGSWLRGRVFERLLELGYARALTSPSVDPERALTGLTEEGLAALLDRPMPPVLISTLLCKLSQSGDSDGQPTWRDAFARGLAARIAAPPGPDERALANWRTVRAVHRQAPPLMAAFSSRLLRPALAGERARAGQIGLGEFRAVLGGALECVKLTRTAG
jgi:hypothetical protein